MTTEQVTLIVTIVEGIVSIVTLLSLLGSFYFVFRQTQRMTEQSAASIHATISSTYQAISLQAIAINTIFFENPELKKYFYGNVPPPKDDSNLRVKIESLAEIHMDFMDMAMVQVTTTPTEVNIPFSNYEIYFRQILSTSPIMREYYVDYREWYCKPVQQIADEVMKQYR